MAVRVGSLFTFVTDMERKGDYARFYLDDIQHYIDQALEAAFTLDDLVIDKLREHGVEPDPDNYNYETEHGPEILDLVHCRNILEEQYDMLVMIKDLALHRKALEQGKLN